MSQPLYASKYAYQTLRAAANIVSNTLIPDVNRFTCGSNICRKWSGYIVKKHLTNKILWTI